MYTTNDLEFPQLEIFEDCSRAPPPPEPTNTRRASPISPRPSSAISPRHFLSRSLKSILVPQKAHIIHTSPISPWQFHSHQGPLLYNSVGRVYRTKKTPTNRIFQQTKIGNTPLWKDLEDKPLTPGQLPGYPWNLWGITVQTFRWGRSVAVKVTSQQGVTFFCKWQ